MHRIEYTKAQIDVIFYVLKLIEREDMSVNKGFERIKKEKVPISRSAFYTLAANMSTLHTLEQSGVDKEIIIKVAEKLNIEPIYRGFKAWQMMI